MSNKTSNDRLAKLSWSERIGYGLGDAGFNFYWIIIGSYLSLFYTDIFGLSPAVAGTMFLVTKIVDAFTDPAMGAIADRTNSRWGKFRPYLLFGAIPMAGAAVLTMTTPDLSDNGKIIWAYATYTLMMLCYTILSTPYSSLAGVITADADVRNSIFGIRFFFAYAVGTIVGLFTPSLASSFAVDGDPARGWQITMALYASVATLLFWVTFFTTKERVAPPAGQQTNPIDDIKDLLANKPWLILFALAMIIMMTIVFRGSSATYYFKYFVERPDLMGPYIGMQMAAYAVGCLASPYLARWIVDKAKLLMLLMAIVGTLSVVFAFVPKPEQVGVVTLSQGGQTTLTAEVLLGAPVSESDQLTWYEHKAYLKLFTQRIALNEEEKELSLADAKSGQAFSVIKTQADGTQVDSSSLPTEIIIMFILNVLISLALGPKSPIAWSMYADAADYNEWKTGRRATAMTFSAATFSQKLGGAIGSAGVLWVLASVGYAANQVQEGASLTSIVWLQTLVPAFFAFVSVAVLRFYDLSGAKLQQIQLDLKARHEE
ncbi:MAG: MFS transporter [Marinagarivorans sp.]|nr:MFS transporter [Marinagarivorans sp.]